MNMVNSDYSANASDLKNCYLLFNSNFTEDSAYGNAVYGSAFCFDNSHLSKCERCYNSFWLTNCYQTNFSSQCEDCNNVWFSKNCRGCSDCFGCANLRGKKYHIFNEPYSKEDYEKKLHSLSLHTASGIDRAKAKANAFWSEFPNKYMQVPPHKDLMDVTVGGNGMELSYEDVVCGWGKLYKVKFCAECWPDDVD